MDLLQFFDQFSSILFDQTSVVCFRGSSYQFLFMQNLQKQIELKINQKMKKISFESDFAQLQLQLSTTFLGQKYWYFLGDIGSSLAFKKKSSDIIDFLESYQGPHTLLYFVSIDYEKQMNVSNGIQVSLNDGYTSDQVKKMLFLYDEKKPEISAYFFNKLYKLNKEYSLDQLCLLKEYANLLGKNIDIFFESWIEKLIKSDVSLFYISELFFKKNAQFFFEQWKEIRDSYSDQFWTAYFSEQLFKAYFYVKWNGTVPIDQKQMQYGLPFTFLKQDWKMYTIFELQLAHQKIYEIDLSFKLGGSAYRLDLFFAQFFSGSFS